MSRDQYYVFAHQFDSGSPVVMVEVFTSDLGHHCAPSPFNTVEAAVKFLEDRHPSDLVDELLPSDIGDALTYCR